MSQSSIPMHKTSAVAELDRAWRTDPEGGFANLVEQGTQHLRDGRIAEARIALEQAEALNPDDHQVQNLLGLTLYKAGDLERAGEAFEVLLARYPDEPTLLMNMGLVRLKQSAFADARSRFERLLAQRPGHKRAASYLGLVCEQLGDLTAAARSYHLAGNYPAAEHVLRRHADKVATGPREPAVPVAAALAPEASDPTELAPAEPVAGSPDPASLQPAPIAPEVSSPAAEAQQATPAPAEMAAVPVDAPDLEPSEEAPTAALAQQQEPPVLESAAVNTAAASHDHPSEVTDLVAGARPAATTVEAGVALDLGDMEPLEPTAKVTLLDGLVLLRLDDEAMLRSDRWVGRFGDLDSEMALRRQKGAETDEPLGGDRPLIAVKGTGTALLRVDEAIAVTATLDGELFVVESRLLALIGPCRHETARLNMPDGTALSLLRMRGEGQVVMVADCRPARLRITLGTPVVVLASSLLAFVGKVLPRVAPAGPRSAASPPMLHLLGEGEAWVDGGSLLPFEVIAAPAPAKD